MKIAKADLVPKDTNLRGEYASFAELEMTCELFMEDINSRVHRATLEIPQDMRRLIERPKLHPIPPVPVTASFGHVRQVPPNTSMVTYEHARYSVPHTLMGQRVWVRGTDTHVIIVYVDKAGPVEVARHKLTRPGVPAIIDAHFPPASAGSLERVIRPSNKAEEEFLALGGGGGVVA